MPQLKSYLSYGLLSFFWILFSLRIYPSSLEKTLIESFKILIGSGLYGIGLTIIVNWLKFRFTKQTFTGKQYLRWILWLALLTSLSASLEHYFRIKG